MTIANWIRGKVVFTCSQLFFVFPCLIRKEIRLLLILIYVVSPVRQHPKTAQTRYLEFCRVIKMIHRPANAEYNAARDWGAASKLLPRAVVKVEASRSADL